MTTDERLDRLEELATSLYWALTQTDPERFPNIDPWIQQNALRAKELVEEIRPR